MSEKMLKQILARDPDEKEFRLTGSTMKLKVFL